MTDGRAGQRDRPDRPRSSLGTTRLSTLLAIAAVCAALGWTGVRVATSVSGSLPEVALSAPLALVFLVAVLAGGRLRLIS